MLHTLFFLLGAIALFPQALAHWSCSALSDTTMVPSIAYAEAQLGSASYIQGHLAEPWPLIKSPNGRQLRAVRYCYADKATRDLLHCKKVMPALLLWAKGLGVSASAEKGHSVGWLEANNGKTDPKLRKIEYCFIGYGIPGLGLSSIWNNAVDEDTLVIYSKPDSSSSSATVGYNNFRNEKHVMTVGSESTVAVVAHEFGHVLGMVHEQCRNDRDHYVLYRCNKVQGYDSALAKAINDGLSRDDAHNKLCDDQTFARKYGFHGAQFTKNDALSTNQGAWGGFDEPAGFDTDSIMLYSSYAFSNVQACGLDWNECPLVQIHRNEDGSVIGATAIPVREGPSAGDIAWVKRRYHWEGDALAHE